MRGIRAELVATALAVLAVAWGLSIESLMPHLPVHELTQGSVWSLPHRVRAARQLDSGILLTTDAVVVDDTGPDTTVRRHGPGGHVLWSRTVHGDVFLPPRSGNTVWLVSWRSIEVVEAASGATLKTWDLPGRWLLVGRAENLLFFREEAYGDRVDDETRVFDVETGATRVVTTPVAEPESWEGRSPWARIGPGGSLAATRTHILGVRDLAREAGFSSSLARLDVSTWEISIDECGGAAIDVAALPTSETEYVLLSASLEARQQGAVLWTASGEWDRIIDINTRALVVATSSGQLNVVLLTTGAVGPTLHFDDEVSDPQLNDEAVVLNHKGWFWAAPIECRSGIPIPEPLTPGAGRVATAGPWVFLSEGYWGEAETPTAGLRLPRGSLNHACK